MIKGKEEITNDEKKNKAEAEADKKKANIKTTFQSYDEMRAAKGYPQAATGGFVTKTGLVKVHAGELISPLSDELKDRVENAVTTGSDIAKKDAIKDSLKTKFMLQEQAKYQKEAMNDFAKTNNMSTATIINNVTNSISSSMQSVANSLGNQDKGHYDPLAQQILQGDLL